MRAEGEDTSVRKDSEALEQALEGIRSTIGMNASTSAKEIISGRIADAVVVARRLASRGATTEVEARLQAAAALEPEPHYIFRGSYDEAEARGAMDEQRNSPDWPLRVRRYKDALAAVREQSLEGRDENAVRDFERDLDALHRQIGTTPSTDGQTEIDGLIQSSCERASALHAEGRGNRVAFRLDRAAAEPVAPVFASLRELMSDPQARERVQTAQQEAEHDLPNRQARYQAALCVIRAAAQLPPTETSEATTGATTTSDAPPPDLDSDLTPDTAVVEGAAVTEAVRPVPESADRTDSAQAPDDPDVRMLDGKSSFLLATRLLGDLEGGSIWPVVTESGDLLLEHGENVVWWFTGEIECQHFVSDGIWRTTWTMPSRANILFTDRRLAFICAKYERRQAPGSVAAGQIRYEWVNTVRAIRSRNSLSVRAIDSDGVFRQVIIEAPKGGNAPADVRVELAPEVIRAAAQWRLANQHRFPLEDGLAVFEAVAADPTAIRKEIDRDSRYFLGWSVAVGGSTIAGP